MDSAYYVTGTSKNHQAHSVEVCQCPAEYNGTSCQDPGRGYYRWKSAVEQGSEKQLVDFVGVSRRCECNGRSDECNVETGECVVRKILKTLKAGSQYF